VYGSCVNPSHRTASTPAIGAQPRGGNTVAPLVSVSPGQAPGGATVLEKAPERVRKTSPRYKVLLHNDPVNSMEYVVVTLRQVVPSLSEQDAIAVMLETHNTGVGLVIVCDIEPAEFYCETLKAKGLTSTIEPES
jgi:ATP-dependent Clp protease adaptor protein ClpS